MGNGAERDEKGRFIPGNKASPGRAPRKREERFLEVTLESVSFDDWKEIVRKAKEQAKRGDAVARKWLSDYLIGAVQQKLDLTSAGEKIVQVEYINTPYPATGLPSGASQDSTEPEEV